MFRKALIANRGEIAVRIIRSCRELGIASVAVYSEVDRTARHVREADEAIALGGRTPAESYLRGDAILEAARKTGARAIHPGYGFLSENTAFAEACETAGVAFIGPTPDQIRDFGLKHEARRIARENDVPLLPGSDLLADLDAARAAAGTIGYPVMLKSTAGGGGIGMRLCWNETDLTREFETTRELGRKNFADDGIFLERYVERARHVEVQIFGDGQGRVIALGERDCSVQRRNQKVIEETPAPLVPPKLREQLHDSAVRLGKAVDYRSAGTVEFVYDAEREEFYFLEVNTRLQVEHGVTENVTGVDLVAWMLRLAAGESDFIQEARPQGHSIQVRVYAEDPARDFRPSSGLVDLVAFPVGPSVRVDAWIESGTEVSPYYDPLLAKIMVTGKDRGDALDKLSEALAETKLYGIQTNREYLAHIIAGEDFRAGRVWTRMLENFAFRPSTVEVTNPGLQTAIQDYPGRLGYWRVGIPPSGPMDSRSARIGNALLGNDEDAATLEMTVAGPTLKFHAPALICLTGAPMPATVDGNEAPYWQPFVVPAGGRLKMGTLRGGGARSYLSVRGGWDVPAYLGSRATFSLGGFGGHGGRDLRTGDMLRLPVQAITAAESTKSARSQRASTDAPTPAADFIGTFDNDETELRVLNGPHGAPDFFTEEYIETFFTTAWEVHYNSARTGVRLIGPRPGWVRADGGEAGLHPSNIHDNAYAVGTIDFTGDMPIILGPDGPSLGGFVCPATVIAADLWKLGQLRPGGRVRFRRVNRETAALARHELDALIKTIRDGDPVNIEESEEGGASNANASEEAVLGRADGNGRTPGVCYRQAGDRYLLVEYGPMELDLNLRFRVHALMQWLEHENPGGILELTPGIRSLQIQYEPRRLRTEKLLALLARAEDELPSGADYSVPSRVVHLPLSWNDPATRKAVDIYMKSVWPDAPWCPDNLEFIRRINGLDSIERVREIVFDARYLVLGLGDVYLGAPVATPLDPRHRLVTTKYNPARTWTPQNAVGIGGAYLCVYGMEGPGGYQFVGRTCQVWNTFQRTGHFEAEPFLLRFFDQIRFFPVSDEELLDIRHDFPVGRYRLKIKEENLSLAEYNAFLNENADSIAAFKSRQQSAFEAERERWKSLPPPPVQESATGGSADELDELPEGSEAIDAPLQANVWKVLVEPGQRVAAAEAVLILEAMKMEVAVHAPADGVVREILCKEGGQAAPGQRLVVLETGARD